MRKKICLTLALAATFTISNITQAQTRRRQPPKRARASKQKAQRSPEQQIQEQVRRLNDEQRGAILSALERERVLEVTFQYDNARYVDEAHEVINLLRDVSGTLPDGRVKLLIDEIADAHENTAFINSKVVPRGRSETPDKRALREAIKSREEYDRSIGGTKIEERQRAEAMKAQEEAERIAQILDRYGIQSLPPLSAQTAIVSIAAQFREFLLQGFAR